MKLDAQWIVGFTDGEGCFHIAINRNQRIAIGLQVLAEFTVVQHVRDIQTLYALKTYFNCGVVRKNHGDRYCYRVRGINDLINIIIPFFEKHSLKTSKNIDFKKFRKTVLIMMNDQQLHLSLEGIDEIRKVQLSMNNKSKIESNSGRDT